MEVSGESRTLLFTYNRKKIIGRRKFRSLGEAFCNDIRFANKACSESSLSVRPYLQLPKLEYWPQIISSGTEPQWILLREGLMSFAVYFLCAYIGVPRVRMFPVGMETKGPPRFTLTGYLKPVDRVAFLPSRHDTRRTDLRCGVPCDLNVEGFCQTRRHWWNHRILDEVHPAEFCIDVEVNSIGRTNRTQRNPLREIVGHIIHLESS